MSRPYPEYHFIGIEPSQDIILPQGLPHPIGNNLQQVEGLPTARALAHNQEDQNQDDHPGNLEDRGQDAQDNHHPPQDMPLP